MTAVASPHEKLDLLQVMVNSQARQCWLCVQSMLLYSDPVRLFLTQVCNTANCNVFMLQRSSCMYLHFVPQIIEHKSCKPVPPLPPYQGSQQKYSSAMDLQQTDLPICCVRIKLANWEIQHSKVDCALRLLLIFIQGLMMSHSYVGGINFQVCV